MSYQTANEPVCTSAEGAVELLIEPVARDLGGFSVRRVLPSRDRRMVGPFIFFDHMGPSEFPPGEGVQIRPHPHIGLATITYLFAGEILHRDSLGYVQPIQAGAVNLMTAGRGIVHSERAGDDLNTDSLLHGIQSWMALPLEMEECEPEFVHYPAADLPELEVDGVRVRAIVGEAFGLHSPVATYAPTLYLECQMPAGATLALPRNYDECAAYVVDGEINIADQSISDGLMAVIRPGKSASLKAKKDSHVMIIGGAHLGKRHIRWNFVASSRERITQAEDDWRNRRFDPVPGDDEFIPLPG
ncbi:MAG TPA: pirin family protein [Woeseiaceae bacterium]|nr:pirin family protein [Woeseiaceae bacterium]